MLVLLSALWLRWDVHPQTYFADELIPHAVVQHMLDSHTLDTNWEHADWRGDFAGGFYNLKQYNFSSYHTTLWCARQLAVFAGFGDVRDLPLYRVCSVFFQLLTLLLVFFIARRLAGAVAGVLAASAFAWMPQAVIDAHYARPESFVMLLVALAAWLALRARDSGMVVHDGLAAAVWGVAVACKFSFAPMALLAWAGSGFRSLSVPALLRWPIFFVAGVFVSAPYVLLDFSGFLHGIHLLLNQYSAEPVSESWLDTVIPSAAELFPYLHDFFGWPFGVLVALSLFSKRKVLRCFAVGVLAVSVLYLLIFAKATVFFERNLSHLLPLWSVCFALGVQVLLRQLQLFSCRTSWASLAAVLLSLSALAYGAHLSWKIVDVIFHNADVWRKQLVDHDTAVLDRHAASRVLAMRWIPDESKLGSLPADVVIRMPVAQQKYRMLVREIFQSHGYVFSESVAMPLGELAYSQLQINHLPAAYDYYVHDDRLKARMPP